MKQKLKLLLAYFRAFKTDVLDTYINFDYNYMENWNEKFTTKEGKKLVHTCLEGPENGVYVRGKLIDESVIELPEYWTKLVDESSISISITPLGNSQDIFVSKIENNKIFLQEKESLPISCFYHIFGTRNDIH